MTRVQRQWGHYTVLLENKGYTVKELVIDAGKCLSDQRHHHRKEEWLIVSVLWSCLSLIKVMW